MMLFGEVDCICSILFMFFFFFKQKTAYGISSFLVGSEMCIRDPIRLHSSIKKETDLISFILLESTEAIYSAG